MKIAEGVYRLQTCYATLENIPLAGYLVVGSDRVALIDALIPRAVSGDVPLVLERLGLGLSDIDLVLITHGHPDHAGGLAELRSVNPDLEVRCGAADQAWVEDQGRMFDELFLRYPEVLPEPDAAREYVLGELCGAPTAVTATVAPGDSFDLGETSLCIVDASGHTPGHIAIFDDRSGAVFTGDAVQGSGISYVNGPHALPPLFEDVPAYIRTQRRLIDLEPSVLLSAHHDPRRGVAARDLLQLSIDTARRSESLVRQALTEADAPLSIHDVAVRLEQLTNAADTEHYVGPLQFHVDAAAHVADLSASGELREVETGHWAALT